MNIYIPPIASLTPCKHRCKLLAPDLHSLTFAFAKVAESTFVIRARYELHESTTQVDIGSPEDRAAVHRLQFLHRIHFVAGHGDATLERFIRWVTAEIGDPWAIDTAPATARALVHEGWQSMLSIGLSLGLPEPRNIFRSEADIHGYAAELLEVIGDPGAVATFDLAANFGQEVARVQEPTLELELDDGFLGHMPEVLN